MTPHRSTQRSLVARAKARIATTAYRIHPLEPDMAGDEAHIEERKKRIRLIRHSLFLLRNALRANDNERTEVVRDHLERVIEYMEASENA